MPTYRQSGQDITVSTFGGNDLLCQLINASIDFEVDSEDARAVCSNWGFAWAVAKSYSISGEFYVGQSVPFLTDLISGDALVTFTLNTGPTTITGDALITSLSYSFGTTGTQKVSVTLSGQGAPVES